MTVLANERITLKDNNGELIKEIEPRPQVRIKQLKQGLNVRAGPGTGYYTMKKVNSGEIYNLVDQTHEWYQIELNETANGWIFANFAEIIKLE